MFSERKVNYSSDIREPVFLILLILPHCKTCWYRWF